ncbi:hypothetical protein Mgra_00001596 [Meloidogyne graminicola]|uniref:Uncharacterized protein n=1 Tax=Meloidogyne graminicola TaxID=189291 RepID=A0A8T0A0J5_9BILA|nr:hypothetical protein Mgra_00001596 [Meloidogyne graminicola]
MAYSYHYFNNFQKPQPLYKTQSYRIQPDILIRSVTATKILQEQRRAAEAKASAPPFGSVRMRPEFLIQAVTESKLAQKRAATAARLAAAEIKRATETEKLTVQRVLNPPNFNILNNNSMLKLADFVPASSTPKTIAAGPPSIPLTNTNALRKQQSSSKPSSSSLTTLTPVPIKRKIELPLGDIGNIGSKHRRGRPSK